MNQINFNYMKGLCTFVPSMKYLYVLVAVCLLNACGPSGRSASLDSKTFYEQAGAYNVQIVDVRRPAEFEESHIKNAVNIDIESKDFDQKISELYKDVPVYVYCRSGKRSAEAAEKMKKLGFKEIYNLQGGLDEWTSIGFPVEVKQVEEPEPDFKTAINGDKLVMVDFNATWCGPCKMMQPFVDRIHKDRKDEVIVFSIDTDREKDLAMEYQIAQLPTVMLFKGGKVLERKIGFMEESKLNELVDKYK